MCALGLVLAFKTKYKITGLVGVAVLGTLMLAVVPADVIERLSSIRGAHESDRSVIGRLRAWQVCLQVINDHPVFGVGMRNILQVYGRYGEAEEVRVAHNAYLQMAVDAGLPAVFLFLSAIALSFWRLRRARRIFRARAPDSKLILYTHGMEAALAGYLVSASFLSRHDLELLYEVIALSTSFILIARSYESEAEVREQVATAPRAFAAEPEPAAAVR
jgi:O-antigen ligase